MNTYVTDIEKLKTLESRYCKSLEEHCSDVSCSDFVMNSEEIVLDLLYDLGLRDFCNLYFVLNRMSIERG